MLRSGSEDSSKDPIDVNYEKLKTDIKVTGPAPSTASRPPSPEPWAVLQPDCAPGSPESFRTAVAREPARLPGPGCCCCWSLGNHSVRPVNSTLFAHRAPQPGPRFGLETGFWGALRKGFFKLNVEMICFWRLSWHEPRRVCSWYPFSEVEVSHGGFNKNTCRGLYSPAEAAVLAQQSLNFSVLEVRAEITLPRPNPPPPVP